MKVELDVPLFKQKDKDYACGLVCLQMILEYYSKKLTYDELLKIGKIDKWAGTWAAQLAGIAIDLGFDAEVINFNLSRIYDKRFFGANNKQLLNLFGDKKVKERAKEFRMLPELKWNKKLMKEGGQFAVKVSTKKELINWLKQGIPVLVSVKVGPAYGWPPSKERRKTVDQHFIIVRGIDDKFVYINDPNPKANAITKLLIDVFMLAWYEGKAYTVLIKKK